MPVHDFTALEPYQKQLQAELLVCQALRAVCTPSWLQLLLMQRPASSPPLHLISPICMEIGTLEAAFLCNCKGDSNTKQ